eukprot:6184621-Pleurochrysis_carterae.AAC.1
MAQYGGGDDSIAVGGCDGAPSSSRSPSQSLPRGPTPPQPLTLAHTDALSRSRIQTLSHSLSLPPSSLISLLPCTHSYSLSLTLTHSHSLSLTLTRARALQATTAIEQQPHTDDGLVASISEDFAALLLRARAEARPARARAGGRRR